MLQNITDYYNQIKNEGDSRTQHLLLVNDPVYVAIAIPLYLLMVILGPKIMENKKPLQLRGVLLLYNFFSVALSIWLLYEFTATTFLNPDFNIICQEYSEQDRSPMTMRLITAHWLYFLSKFLECADTFFFIVRKKNNQITFLHTYHHAFMICLQWLLVKYAAAGVVYLGPLLNSFVHTLMYSYYLLSSFGPQVQKYLWWKKYLTKMQIFQFIVIITYLVHALYIGCRFWDAYLWLCIAFLVSLVHLFTVFYVHSYIKRKQQLKKD